jgi:hypothetical protein
MTLAAGPNRPHRAKGRLCCAFFHFRIQDSMRSLFIAFLLTLPAITQAQVYKCNVDGKTIYQASPCTAGKGSTVNIPRGPSEQDVKDAQARANADRSHGSALNAPAKPAPKAEQPKAASRAGNCDELNRQYAELVRKRDNAVRLERKLPSAPLTGGRDYVKEEFDRLEEQMRKANCAVPGA